MIQTILESLDPAKLASIKSSLTFLRKTPWAREKVERWYLKDLP